MQKKFGQGFWVWVLALLTPLLIAAALTLSEGASNAQQSHQSSQLKLTEQLLDARLALWREQSQAQVQAVVADSVLRRALADGHGEAVQAVLLAFQKRTQAQGVYWVSSRGQVRLSAQASAAKKGAGFEAGFQANQMAPLLEESVRLGRAYAVLAPNARLVSSVSAAALPNDLGVIVATYDLNKRIDREALASGMQIIFSIDPQKTLPVGSHRIFVGDTLSGQLAIEFSATAQAPGFGETSVIALALGLLVCVGAAFGLWRHVNQPSKDLENLAKELALSNEPIKASQAWAHHSLAMAGLHEAVVKLVQQSDRKEQHWRKLALRDALTALPNAMMIHERLGGVVKAASQANKSVSVLRIDLEAFRSINDSLGYAAGDQLLREVGERIRSLLRGASTPARLSSELGPNLADVFEPAVGRLGGDDFIAILPDCDASQGQRVASRVNDALVRPFSIEGHKVHFKCHIGLASFPEHSKESGELIRAAETAQVNARSTQRTICVYNLGHEQQREQQLGLLSELRRALEGNQLKLMFQPKVSLRNDPRLRVEALIRWDHPERGLQSPAAFLPMAERTGFITSITRWVIDSALLQVVQWRKLGLDIQVAVNLAVLDVRNNDLPTFVIERLRHYDLPPDVLTVELSEAALKLDPEQSKLCLQVLDRFGVKLAIDDFAGGSSALSYLDELPVSAVKIERSLIHALPSDSAKQVLVRSAIEFAHLRNLLVMAEGVEDAATLQVLRQLSCDFAQGYYFGKPLPADAIPSWVSHQARRFLATDGAFTELAVGI
jgi:predicted signal transduction protein with EAL and GGDEF domain